MIVRLRRVVGTSFIAAGIAALSWTGFVTGRADDLRSDLTRTPPAAVSVLPRPGTPLGLLEIPRLGLTSAVVEGDGPASLLVAVGHLSDTPLPWQAGNSAFAGHRDTDFRPLKAIRHGDLIRLATADSKMQYVVREIEIVEPTDLRVLLPTEQPTLTLITCYPFGYIGAAPQRFVVRAERTSVSGRRLLRRTS